MKTSSLTVKISQRKILKQAAIILLEETRKEVMRNINVFTLLCEECGFKGAPNTEEIAAGMCEKATCTYCGSYIKLLGEEEIHISDTKGKFYRHLITAQKSLNFLRMEVWGDPPVTRKPKRRKINT